MEKKFKMQVAKRRRLCGNCGGGIPKDTVCLTNQYGANRIKSHICIPCLAILVDEERFMLVDLKDDEDKGVKVSGQLINKAYKYIENRKTKLPSINDLVVEFDSVSEAINFLDKETYNVVVSVDYNSKGFGR